MNYIASIFCTFIICHSPQKSSAVQKVYRAGLATEGRPVFVQPLRRCAPAPLVGEPLAKPFTLRGLPKPPLLGATATTAASDGNREELLGPRPAGCERQRSRRWEPQPGQWHRAAMTERLYEDRAFPLQESPARGIASCIFLPKFMVYLFCGLARPLTPDQQDGMGGKTCCCCRKTCFFKLYADKLEKRRFTQNVQPQKNCGLLWHYR